MSEDTRFNPRSAEYLHACDLVDEWQKDQSEWFRDEIVDIVRQYAAWREVGLKQAPVMETCDACSGSGYGGHPDSGLLCTKCKGSGGYGA